MSSGRPGRDSAGGVELRYFCTFIIPDNIDILPSFTHTCFYSHKSELSFVCSAFHNKHAYATVTVTGCLSSYASCPALHLYASLFDVERSILEKTALTIEQTIGLCVVWSADSKLERGRL